MPDQTTITALAAKAEALRALHAGPRMLVLPNAWDAASAKAFEAAGFPAIATTSAGVALAMGYEDHQQAPPAEMIASARRITNAVSVPVTIDFEAGYGLSPREVVETIIEAGGAGLNFEDMDHSQPGELVDAEVQAGKIAQIVEAGRAAGVPLVVNARVDVFIQRRGTPEEQAAEGLRRARLYKDAGADCIYPILLADEAVIPRFVEAVGAINVNLRPGGQLTLRRCTELGVRRISYAASLYRATMTSLEGITASLKGEVDALP